MKMVHSDGVLGHYLQRVRAIPRLSREVEHDLAIQARAGDVHAAHQLVEANLRFVAAVALQYRRYGIPIWELIAEGSLGLMMAVGKFDPERGTRFVTYAGYWIRAYVLDLVVKSTSMVGAGSGALRSKLFFRLRRERAQIANLEQDPEKRIAMLAARFNMSVDKARAMLAQLDARDVSLDTTLRPDSSLTMLETLRDDDDDQEVELLAHERSERLRTGLSGALEVLDGRERYIVEQRLMADDELSLAELGRRLGVSRERARQLEARAKRKLRRELQGLAADAA
ncbi:MAG TPA: sigma-70 family RNA polymerase sigma factor [Polyangiales bacterium]|nr:sigma-70 family RNA polymerase sigma factor [Polyangiales bacterium]